MTTGKLLELVKYRKKYVYTIKYCLELQRGQESVKIRIERKLIISKRTV